MRSAPTAIAAPSPDNSLFGRDITAEVFKRWLLFLFLLGLAVRMWFVIEHAHSPSFGILTLDQKYYDLVARMLLAGRDLHELHGFRPLLYPILLAGLYQIGGSAGITLVLFFQHLLGVLTGILVAMMGARLFQHRLCGLIAGGLYLLAPVPLYFEGEVLIASSYTFMICATLWLHFCTAEIKWRSEPICWLLCGALVALTAQWRPNILIFMAIYPLLAGWRWWRYRNRSSWLPLLGLLGVLGMMIPWGILNLRQANHFHLIPGAGGVNLYLGNEYTADGMQPKISRRVNISGEHYEDSVEVWGREEYAAAERAQGRVPNMDPTAISDYWTHRTLEEIKAHPLHWLHLMAKKTWLMFWNVEVPNNKSFAFLQQEFASLRVLPVRWVVLLVLAPAGIWAAFKWGNRNALCMLLVFLVFYSLGNIAFFICDRYRYPEYPAMAVIAGGGLWAAVQTIRRRRFRNLLWMLAAAGVMAALSLHNWFGAVLPNFARDYQFRAYAWFQTGHFPQALQDIDRSLALDPTDVTSREQRASVLLALNRLDEARQAFEKILSVYPEESAAWNNLGLTLERQNHPEEALRAFRRGAACQPPSKNSILGMAFIQIRLGRLDAAIASLDRLDQLNKAPTAATLAARSVIARQQKNPSRADALEKQAKSLDAKTAAWAIQQATSPNH